MVEYNIGIVFFFLRRRVVMILAHTSNTIIFYSRTIFQCIEVLREFKVLPTHALKKHYIFNIFPRRPCFRSKGIMLFNISKLSII